MYYLLNELVPEREVQAGREPYDVPKDLPRWNINPTTEQTVKFLNKSTDPDGDNLTYVWSLNGKDIGREKDFSTTLSEGGNIVRLTVSDGKLESSVERKIAIDPSQLFGTKELRNDLIKGMIYETGFISDYLEDQPDVTIDMNRNLPKERVRLEIIDIINKELDCNALA